MHNNLFFEIGSHSKDLMIDKKLGKINFKDYEDEICYSFSVIHLYLVDDDYYNFLYEEDKIKYRELIATIEGYFCDTTYGINYGIKIQDILDTISTDTATLIPYLLDKNGEIKKEYCSYYNNIYYLDRIFVEEKFRNKGYASFILENLIEILIYLAKVEVGIIMVQAQPFDKVNGKSTMDYKNKDRIERLIKLYERNGFNRMNESNYLIKINET